MLMQIFKIVVPVLMALVLSYDPVKAVFSTTTSERIILSCVTYLLWTAIDILRYTKKLYERELQHGEIWSIDSEFEVILNNIRKHYHDISKRFYGNKDLFKDYFTTSLSSIAQEIKNAAEKHEVYVKDYHFSSTELVLEAFKGDDTQILRYVWVLEHDEPFFNDTWKNYCKQIDETIKQGQIKEVRALLIKAPEADMKDRRVLALLGFFCHSKGYDYRVIDSRSYDELSTDSQIDRNYIDFGIYGKRYIFRTKKYEPIPCGDFSKDQSLIERYTKFFDLSWKSHAATQLSKKDLNKVSLSELFVIDARRFQTH